MVNILFVSCGAILGANTRFQIHKRLNKLILTKYSLILIINTFASFFLGLFLSLIENISFLIYSYQLVLFFLIGFLGSFSTFSSFIYDLYDLCLQLKFVRALNLFIFSASLGITAFSLGFLFGK
tara:strand:+ start:732 stop:1103 length:372 start_codon:yes stop_codon:yes gene_type:complete